MYPSSKWGFQLSEESGENDRSWENIRLKTSSISEIKLLS